MHRKHSTIESGVSIIEVLIVVAIAAILVGIAIPAFNLFIGNTRTSTIANEFVSALNLARSEAMKRGTNVTVCRSTNGTACAASGDWGQGWMVYVMDGTTLVPLRVREGFKETKTFVGVGHFLGNNAVVAYQPDGRLNATINEANDYFKIDNMGKTMCIYINSSGRIRSQKNC
ncbi:MAG TPA: prepilin-type N-terminal cleavage/methylation domain-containing protein [Desulfonatronum sp.]|nr:prepilin-type N-terminal cleavage/methylation domain-containing protein [Desulfonatronum sp.]